MFGFDGTAAGTHELNPDGGWSAAQITWHVALVNESFAGWIDGSRPVAHRA